MKKLKGVLVTVITLVGALLLCNEMGNLYASVQYSQRWECLLHGVKYLALVSVWVVLWAGWDTYIEDWPIRWALNAIWVAPASALAATPVLVLLGVGMEAADYGALALFALALTLALLGGRAARQRKEKAVWLLLGAGFAMGTSPLFFAANGSQDWVGKGLRCFALLLPYVGLAVWLHHAYQAEDEEDLSPEEMWSVRILSGVLGLAVADALGVPVEFQGRAYLIEHPVTDMQGHGTYDQPKGTWSDDTSMTLCLLETLVEGDDLAGLMDRFARWMGEGDYTPWGTAFDMGRTSRRAIERYRAGQDPTQCGLDGEQDNGNGALMRILPLLFELERRCVDWTKEPPAFESIRRVSSVTHAHMRSVIACGIYLLLAEALSLGLSPKEALGFAMERAGAVYGGEPEFTCYSRLAKAEAFAPLPVEEINSSGYVVDTLEAAVWCLLNTDSYRDCVLRAVNLGGDTDTVAAVAGGLAGLYYGIYSIPEEWLSALARRDYIEGLCAGFAKRIVGDEGETEAEAL